MPQVHWQNGTATWQPGKTLRVVHLTSGWAARLLVHEERHSDAFPYNSQLDAQYMAEEMAAEAWGPPTP